MIAAHFTVRVSETFGVWLLTMGVVLSRLAQRKGIIIISVLAGFFIITSVPRAWFIGVGVMIDGILLSQLLQNRWPYSPRTEPSTGPA
jgi:hypothetical protein